MKKNKTTHVHNLIVVDETGSMGVIQYFPCGCTPLYDAIGMGITKVQSHVHKGDHVLATIITDGEENSSHEWTLQKVRTMIEQLKKQNWTFALIGTENLNVEYMARDFAISNHLKFRQDEEGTNMAFESVSRCMSYMNFCVAEDQAITDGNLFEEAETHTKDTAKITKTYYL